MDNCTAILRISPPKLIKPDFQSSILEIVFNFKTVSNHYLYHLVFFPFFRNLISTPPYFRHIYIVFTANCFSVYRHIREIWRWIPPSGNTVLVSPFYTTRSVWRELRVINCYPEPIIVKLGSTLSENYANSVPM